MKTDSTLKMTRMVKRFSMAFACISMLTISSQAQKGTTEDITYYSTVMSDSVHMNVYVPPGYTDEADTNHYPVFYLVHGYGEDYTYWKDYGQADTVLDYYITHDMAVPMILVMTDGRNLAPDVYSNEMLTDIIPYVESNYRVKTDKDSRGVGGLSWGGQQSMKVGILNYDMFGYMAILSSGYFSQDLFDEADAFLDTTATKVENSMRYFYFAEGSQYDITYDGGMQALEMFREHGLTVHYWEYSGGHQWTVWRQDFKSFTPYLFRDTTTRYISLAFQGGTIKNSTVMTCLDSLATPPADPTRTGYSFAGWYLQPEYVDSFNFATDTIRANMTLYANWSPNPYTVSFNSNGGNYTPDPVVALYRTLIVEPAEPEKEGYVFGGWFKDEALTQAWDFAATKVTGDITLYAKWIDPTALKEIGESTIRVYPNPAHHEVLIGNLPSQAQICLFSTDGKLLIRQDGVSTDEMLDISSLPGGMYYLVVRSSTQNFQQRLVKE
ncbi:MAG: InlB B-repeat-containing protein [Bacteroidales bacterium]|nr:InlB B-repeat-containing protein [Bacteroidales bacterium]